MESFLQKISLQNLLRQFFCGVVFFVPLWLFARTRIVEILGVEKGNTGVYLAFAALASIIGTTIYHLEKNLHSYPLQLAYEYYHERKSGCLCNKCKSLGVLILVIASLVALCMVICSDKPFLGMLVVLVCYFVLSVIMLRAGKKRLIASTLEQWLWEEKAGQLKMEDALPLLSEDDLQKVAAMKKISTWSDFIHCVQSCCFAWIFGCVVIKMTENPITLPNLEELICLCDFEVAIRRVMACSGICAALILLIECLIDMHRYRFLKSILSHKNIK